MSSSMRVLVTVVACFLTYGEASFFLFTVGMARYDAETVIVEVVGVTMATLWILFPDFYYIYYCYFLSKLLLSLLALEIAICTLFFEGVPSTDDLSIAMCC